MRERRQNKSIGQNPNSILVSVCAACVFTALFFLFFPEISPEIKNPAYAKPLATLALSEAENDGGIGLDELSDYSPMFIKNPRIAQTRGLGLRKNSRRQYRKRPSKRKFPP